eukprot:PITA_36563
MIVKEYTEEFYRISIGARQIQDTDEKVARYVNGLRMHIQYEISILSSKTVEDAYQIVLKAKEKLMRKQSARGRENVGTSQRNAIVAQVEGEEPATVGVEEENILERVEYLVIIKVFLKPAKEIAEPPQRMALFRTMCKVQGKCCQMIIDSGNTNNLVSTEVVDKLKLKTMKHPTPYKVSWLQKAHQLFVNEQCELEL